MARFLMCLLLATAAIAAVAQPTLQSGALAYTPGDNWTIYGSSTYQVPQYGAGLTWNFSSLGSGAWVDVIDIIDPSTSLGASHYPDATATDHDPDFSDFFYASSPTEELYLGVWNAVNYRVCDDPQTLVTYPFNYQDAFMDTYDCFETGGGFDRILAGTTNVSYVGYGTVIMPSGIHTDCVLIRTEMAWTTQIVGVPDISTYTLLTHRFYKPGIPVYLVSFEEQTYFDGGIGGGSMYVYFPGLLTTTVAGGAAAPGMHVFPNPAVDEVTLQRPTSDLCHIQLIDSRGRVVLSEQVSGTQSTLSLSGWADGIYTLRMSTIKGVVVQRLVKGR